MLYWARCAGLDLYQGACNPTRLWSVTGSSGEIFELTEVPIEAEGALYQDCSCRALQYCKVEFHNHRGYSSESKQNSLKLYVNSMGCRAIERCTGVNHNTVIQRVKQAEDNLTDAPPAKESPELAQLDKLQTFVGSK